MPAGSTSDWGNTMGDYFDAIYTDDAGTDWPVLARRNETDEEQLIRDYTRGIQWRIQPGGAMLFSQMGSEFGILTADQVATRLRSVVTVEV